MSNRMIVSTSEYSWSESPHRIDLLERTTKTDKFDNSFSNESKLSSQLPPDGTSPPKKHFIFQYLENILNKSDLKLNSVSYQHYKIETD